MRTSVEVHNFLVERDIPHEVFSARGRLRSPERMAAVLDLPLDEVGKVVILEGDGGPVAAVLPASCHPDADAVAQAIGATELRVAPDERASLVTEYLAESMPPAGLPADIPIVIDEALHRDDVLYFAGGEVRAVLKIRGTDLTRATGATVAPITRFGKPDRSA